MTRRFLTSKEMEENAQKRWRNRRTPDKKGRRRGISERSFVEKNVAASEHRALRKAAAEDGEEGERNGKEEEKERKKDAIQAWEENRVETRVERGAESSERRASARIGEVLPSSKTIEDGVEIRAVFGGRGGRRFQVEE